MFFIPHSVLQAEMHILIKRFGMLSGICITAVMSNLTERKYKNEQLWSGDEMTFCFWLKQSWCDMFWCQGAALCRRLAGVVVKVPLHNALMPASQPTDPFFFLLMSLPSPVYSPVPSLRRRYPFCHVRVVFYVSLYGTIIFVISRSFHISVHSWYVTAALSHRFSRSRRVCTPLLMLEIFLTSFAYTVSEW